MGFSQLRIQLPFNLLIKEHDLHLAHVIKIENCLLHRKEMVHMCNTATIFEKFCILFIITVGDKGHRNVL